MRIICQQTILMRYHTLFFRKLGKMSQNLSSAAVVIGDLSVHLLHKKGWPFTLHPLFNAKVTARAQTRLCECKEARASCECSGEFIL